MRFQEEFVSIFTVSSDEVVVDSNKVSPLPSLLKAEQTHVSHSVLLRHVFRLLTFLVALYSVRYVYVLFVLLGSPELHSA